MRGCDRVVDDGRVSVAARVTRVVIEVSDG
jgi:hypothetical protein